MKVYGEEKPSPEDVEHYGVLGMKWGQRKKATGREIRGAQRRIGEKQNKLFDAQDAYKKNRTAKGKAALEKQTKDFLNDPDRAIATRLTRGEKATLAIISGPLGLATIAAVSAGNRVIERKQEDGSYNRKTYVKK